MSAKEKEGTKPASGAVKVTAKKHRWYLGGIASAMAAACTHPLDLLKVGLVWFPCPLVPVRTQEPIR